MPQQFFYIPYLNVVEQVSNMTCMIVAIVLFSNLLLRNAFGRQNALRSISGTLTFYMTYHFICAITAFPCSFYQMIDWIRVLQSSDRQLHKEWADQLGFWFGTFASNYIFVAPVPTLFLTLDRCLVLKFKWAYTKSLRTKMLVANCFVTCSVYLAVTGMSLGELPLQLDKIMNCIANTCFALRFRTLHYYYTRLVVESINVMLSIYFFIMLRRHHQTAKTSLRTRVVKLTLVADIAFSMVPNYIQLIFNTVTGMSLGVYLGTFATTTFMFHPALCSIMYTRIFLSRSQNTKVMTISAQNAKFDTTTGG
ncbi:hypothetical protein DdX_14755 [Ditylenchus destructor]|uniref:Uncharacterized protein n=1 Tax=Ditylenchus destructor TaxID=166010 RepID=A0AAD4R1N8_9BILA|nr:hypothetical protein DdX_14755 [Ditylenchus destructor]